ncbi:hypothetical protein BT69DRAFT_805837 [Atractiella rhizophila]|nr:hypothetical protein BT69DRAFT_805837 [Atractiella rhizophila]
MIDFAQLHSPRWCLIACTIPSVIICHLLICSRIYSNMASLPLEIIHQILRCVHSLMVIRYPRLNRQYLSCSLVCV